MSTISNLFGRPDVPVDLASIVSRIREATYEEYEPLWYAMARAEASKYPIEEQEAMYRAFSQGAEKVWSDRLSAYTIDGKEILLTVPNGDGSAYVYMVYCEPQVRAKGYARAMLAKAALDNDGAVSLHVNNTNKGAYRLYRNMGFIHYPNRAKTEYFMATKPGIGGLHFWGDSIDEGEVKEMGGLYQMLITERHLPAARKMFHELFPDDKLVEIKPGIDCFAEALGNPDVRYYLYLDGENVVGMSGVYVEPADPKSLWLGWFGVREQYRRSGLGRAILKFFEMEARSLGMDYCRLYTGDTEQNRGVMEFYRKCGYTYEPSGEDSSTSDEPLCIFSKTVSGKPLEPWGDRPIELG